MTVVVESRVGCASPVEAMFDVVSDTDRLNRESGLPEISFAPAEKGSSRKIVKSPLGPLMLEYAEQPWEWVRPDRIHVRREYRNGPLTILDVHFDFTSNGRGSEVAVKLEGRPRPLMGPVLKIVLSAIAGKLGKAIERIDRELGGREAPLKQIEVNRTELMRAERELIRLADDRNIASRLVRHVADAPDREVVRIRPFELAQRWGTDKRRTLETALYGVVAGLLELNWDLICPSCRVSAARVPSLSDVEGHGHCTLCDLSFGLALDQAVEATFTPALAVRRVRERQYCTGGPAWTPHVIAQSNLHPGETIEFRAPAEEARYRLFVRGGATVPIDLGPDRPEEAGAEIGERVEPQVIAVRAGGRIKLRGAAGSEGRHVKLERMEWSSAAATAMEVSMLPAFRRQFSQELLRPGLALKVSRVALLFSDLSASTALYTREGDAAAFALVQDHFELLRSCIEANEGVIIKTIGDAVMAAFCEDGAAIRASVAMQKGFPAFRATRSHAEGVFLKIGVYAGSCYAVTANGVLDYFGQTVNVAARLQSQAHDAEIVMTEECASQARALLSEMEIHPPFTAKLKGVEPDIRAVRVRVK